LTSSETRPVSVVDLISLVEKSVQVLSTGRFSIKAGSIAAFVTDEKKRFRDRFNILAKLSTADDW
jgi:hypothetical protein